MSLSLFPRYYYQLPSPLLAVFTVHLCYLSRAPELQCSLTQHAAAERGGDRWAVGAASPQSSRTVCAVDSPMLTTLSSCLPTKSLLGRIFLLSFID